MIPYSRFDFKVTITTSLLPFFSKHFIQKGPGFTIIVSRNNVHEKALFLVKFSNGFGRLFIHLKPFLNGFNLIDTSSNYTDGGSEMLIGNLLQEMIDLTTERFGLYHGHVYLLNASGEVLVMAAGAGDVGRELVLQGHQIDLNAAQSLVAQTARTQQAVVVNDVPETQVEEPSEEESDDLKDKLKIIVSLPVNSEWEQREVRPYAMRSYFFDDHLEFKDQFMDWKKFDHPDYGEVELGGRWKKTRGRLPPRFMNEELCHRNMAFTLYHADEMPKMEVGEYQVKKLGNNVFQIFEHYCGKERFLLIFEYQS